MSFINLVSNPSMETASNAVTVRTNLVTNPSFETNTTGWSSQGTGTRDTAEFYSGSASFKNVMTALNQFAFTSTPISVSANTTYTASVWVKAETGKTFWLQFDDYTAADAYVGSANSGTITGTGNWQRATVTRTLGSTSAKGYLYVVNKTNGAHTFYVDAVQLEVGSTASDYFDGSTAASGDFTYAWSGTAHASTSLMRGVGVANVSAGWAGSNYADYQTSTEALYGTKAWKSVCITPQTFLRGVNVPLTSGKTYTFSYWIKPSVTRSFRAVFASASGAGSGPFVSCPANQWTRISHTGTATSTGTYRVYVNHESTPTSGEYYIIDGMMVVEGTYTGDYFDGNTVADGFTYSWLGTPNASISIQNPFFEPYIVDPPAPLSEVYRVYAYDINTNSFLCEIPASGLSFDRRLNDIGSISFTLPLSRPELAAMVQSVLAYRGNPFKVYVDRNGVIVWSGIIWTWNYDRSSGNLAMAGKELMSYFAKRSIAADYSVSTYPTTDVVGYLPVGSTNIPVVSNAGFSPGDIVTIGSDRPELCTILSLVATDTIVLTTGTVFDHSDQAPVSYSLDPAALVRMAFEDAQNETLCGNGANIGLQIVGGTSTIPRIVPGYPINQHTAVASIASDMANINAPTDGTVDTVITSSWDANGDPVDTMTIYAPRAGRNAQSTGVMFDLSRVLNYTYPLDSGATTTNFIVTGAGTGTAALTINVNSPAPVGDLGELPRLDGVFSFSNIQSESQLSIMAGGVAQQYGYPLSTPTLSQPTSMEPVLGSWALGDDARLYIAKDELFPNGLNEYWRIVQESVQVPDAGVATVSLTFNRPPIF